jgi:putative transcriptional regulator
VQYSRDLSSDKQPTKLGDAELTQNTDPAPLIRELRARLGLTQEKFAARLGVTLPTINRWENGRAKPSPLAIQTLRELISNMGEDGKDLLEKYFPAPK